MGGKDLLELVSKRAVVEEQIGNLVTFLRGRTLFEFNTGKILVGKNVSCRRNSNPPSSDSVNFFAP